MGVPYFVTGSVASLTYGEPRLTHDVDLVLELTDRDAVRIEAAFPADEFYCPPEEVIRIETRRPRRGHFNLIHHATGFKADVYLRSRDALHDWAFEHRRRVGTGPDATWFAPPEYVIVRKLEYYREGGSQKHLTDIQGMLDVLGEDMDYDNLQRWVSVIGLTDLWAPLDPRGL